jgi:preprotein translocase subunit SecE
MNRAVRRQQLKEPKTEKSPSRAVPRTGGGGSRGGGTRGGAAAQTRGAWYKPRWALDIISELRKVIWPSREDVWHLTVVVVIVTVIIGAVLGGIDIAFGWIVDKTVLS